MTIKIWDLGNDWYAAETLDEARATFRYDMKTNLNYETDEEIDEEYSLDNQHEEKDLATLWYVHEDGRRVTFAERLDEMMAEGAVFPCCFANRDY